MGFEEEFKSGAWGLGDPEKTWAFESHGTSFWES